jgi:putative ABC transport system permease protein
MKDMEDDDRIKAIVKTGFYVANLPARKDKAPSTFVGFIYDDELEKLGLVNLKGRHPVFENEISIGVTSAKDLDKTVGDTIQIFLEGQLVTYDITGIYQNLSNLSQGFKMRLEGITEINPLFELNWYDMILQKGEDPSIIRQDILNTYGTSYEIEVGSESVRQIKGILKGIKDVLILISLLFLGVLFVTVFNDTVMSIRENQRNIGILKAVGMTPRQLQAALTIKALIIAILAIVVGVPLSLQIIPGAMDQLASGAGLAKFPYVFDLKNTLLSIPLILIITIGSVWIASQKLLKIRPRILVRE